MIRGRAPRTRPSPPPPLLPLLSLSLLLLSPTVRGDCGPPPDIPNARPILGRHSKFAEQSKVAYSCNNGFKQVPDKSNIVVCLENGQWSSHETFCEKSCVAPERLSFASLKKEYLNMNFFPVGTIVEYECRPGFRKQPPLPGKATCLEDLVWSPVAQFCKKKSCPNPKDLDNGHINIPTGILFGSEINFSCNPGYRLVGVSSTFCSVTGNTVDWDDEFPVCTEIHCPEPPKINNGIMRGESDSYTYSQVVTYSCDKGFILVGNASIYCTVSKSDVGQWSSPPPRCIEKSKVPTKKPTINVPSTGTPSTPQKPTTESVPNPGDQPTPQKPSTVKVSATQHVPVTKTTVRHPIRTSTDKGEPNTGQWILTYMFNNLDSFACDAITHWLLDIANEELRRKYIKLLIILLVC
ncbi:complement decay-accelerating factor, GPI-anchored isoform 3 preproprotein [Mus musculus]|uniref:complement decay-accelerating factor, GPI-anchored isoform 3 preproprotein n=1 Tax=Mus musculus TaxID=10090 RepID=UPI001FD7E9B0|nr:complement decay-accelerating factor, GPI-anchored isoform 3 preproprotein [Mus musculus]